MAISEQVEQMERDDFRNLVEEIVAEETADLREENKQLRQENEQLRDYVEDVETVARTARDTVFELEDAVTGDDGSWKAQQLANDRGSILDRVEDLERGEVDVSDIIDGNNAENQLPIQIATDARKNDRHDFGGNKLRATYVWPQFNKRSKPDSSRMVLYGWQVKQILDDNDLDTNPNTVRRTMEFLAKLTSEKPKEERDPKDDDNLVTFHDEGHENTLVADKDEWEEFFSQQLDAVGDDEEPGEAAEENSTADDATHKVDEDVDGLMAASAVTSSDDDDVTDEAGIEVTR